jgi:hypothetical protein
LIHEKCRQLSRSVGTLNAEEPGTGANIDVNLEPVPISLGVETKQLERVDSHENDWAVRFVDLESGRVHSQLVDLSKERVETWMYPCRYRVWRQPTEEQHDLPVFRSLDAPPVVQVAEYFEAKSGATLDLDAKLVEWTLRGRVDGEPLREWLEEYPGEFTTEGDWRVSLISATQPRGAMRARWTSDRSGGDSEVAFWTPPGEYEVFVDFAHAIKNEALVD